MVFTYMILRTTDLKRRRGKCVSKILSGKYKKEQICVFETQLNVNFKYTEM